MTFVFCGSQSVIGGVVELKAFGQRVDLEEGIARDAIIGGCPLLPVEEFDAIGFTDAELKRFGDVHARAAAPAEFVEKARLAWGRVAEIRAEYEGAN